MTILRIPDALREKLESEMKQQPNRAGTFILSVATSSTPNIAYELEPVTDRAAAIESLASRYRLADLPQRRGLEVNSPDPMRTVGTYYVRIDGPGRISNDELFVLEEFNGVDDSGEYRVCSPDLKAALEAPLPAARSARPRI